MPSSSPTPAIVHVAVYAPVHSGIGAPLSYTHTTDLPPGTLVRVPLGTRDLLGVVWDPPAVAQALPAHAQLRPIREVLLQLPPLDANWRKLVAFAARYYQRSIGEIAMAGLPPLLRDITPEQLSKRLAPPAPAKKRKTKVQAEAEAAAAPAISTPTPDPTGTVQLTAEQQAVCERMACSAGPFLLYGSTGSGKTEVYMQLVQQALAQDAQAQALIMVPEINLTPQLQARFTERFAPLLGPQAVVSLHSGMTEVQRLKSWLAAHTGQARIVLGTRMSIFASLPGLRVIVVDEEHDPSYKQQEGARYSARDLALWRGHALQAQVVLGSATPALESWHASSPEVGRYQRLTMPSRIGAGELPRVRLVDMRQQPKQTVFAAPLLQAISERIARGEQSLVLLNRRGFAPVLYCADCSWKSDCPHCSAHQVFHKSDRSLRCHHCGHSQRVPLCCPSCGNPDILPLGQGTEQLEESLEQALRNVQRPDGQPARIARIDADTTKHKGTLEAQLELVHSGAVDVLVGTQMVAKGHDFRRITLVAAVQPDGALFSSDFRAPERLFCLLMQAAGRAGRDARYMAAQNSHPEMWIQTYEPHHVVYQALRQHDYPAFAEHQLRERRDAAMPPFAFQALVRADAKTQEQAQQFLRAARDAALQNQVPHVADVFIYPPIPMAVQRVANVERAQMLIEAQDRRALQRFLQAWQDWLHWLRAQPQHRSLVRWIVDVDPLSL
ncbi:MAG: primosomal protein N' [Comamonas sp.]